jgi:prephenate dehydratase
MSAVPASFPLRKEEGNETEPTARLARKLAEVFSEQADEAERKGLMHQRIGFQGFPGAYGESAILWLFGGQVSPIGYHSFAEVAQAVAERAVDAGLLPVENSITGRLCEAETLLQNAALASVGDFWRPINHSLLALPGQPLDQIKRVLSHPQALAQCDAWLRELDVEVVAAEDTAGSAKLIREQGLYGVAAIASARAAALYQLEVVVPEIPTARENATRFMLFCSSQVLRVDYLLLRQIKKAREQEQHALAEVLVHALSLRDSAGERDGCAFAAADLAQSRPGRAQRGA